MAEICGITPDEQDVAEEDVAVAAERHHAFLDARARAVVEADHGGADLHREIHDLHDLLGEGAGKASAEDREVLGEHEHLAAVDAPVAGHHAVAQDPLLVHLEVGAAVQLEAIGLDEGSRVHQQLDPLPGGELALLVLALDALRAPAQEGAGVHLVELLQFVFE